MEIEELWDTSDKNMPQYEIQLQRVDADGELFWRFRAKDTSDKYGESIIDMDRKQLKDLHAAIEQELYPERFLPPTTKPIIWDERPKECPVCHTLLQPSRYRRGEGYFCPRHHGKTFTFKIDDKQKYGWYTLQIGDTHE